MNPKDLVGAKKAPLRYVPWALVLGAAPAMEVGALKYGPFNWREQPVSAVTYVEAIMRHLAAWVDGQNTAPDTGIHHFGHAAAGLGILLDAYNGDNLIDDRPTPGPAASMLDAMDKSLPARVPSAREDRVHHRTWGCPVGPGCYACEPITAFEVGQDDIVQAATGGPDFTVKEWQSDSALTRLLREWDDRHASDDRFYGQLLSEWNQYGPKNLKVEVTNRGEYPPDTRVGGLLTCCGQSEHDLKCPKWR